MVQPLYESFSDEKKSENNRLKEEEIKKKKNWYTIKSSKYYRGYSYRHYPYPDDRKSEKYKSYDNCQKDMGVSRQFDSDYNNRYSNTHKDYKQDHRSNNFSRYSQMDNPASETKKSYEMNKEKNSHCFRDDSNKYAEPKFCNYSDDDYQEKYSSTNKKHENESKRSRHRETSNDHQSFHNNLVSQSKYNNDNFWNNKNKEAKLSNMSSETNKKNENNANHVEKEVNSEKELLKSEQKKTKVVEINERRSQIYMLPDFKFSASFSIYSLINKRNDNVVADIFLTYEILSTRILRVRGNYKSQWFLNRIAKTVNKQKTTLPLDDWCIGWCTKGFTKNSNQKTKLDLTQDIEPSYPVETNSNVNAVSSDQLIKSSNLESSSPEDSAMLKLVDTNSFKIGLDTIYPQKLINYCFDIEKMKTSEKYASFNTEYNFITRSLLWCLRPSELVKNLKPDICSEKISTYNDPCTLSVELNADTINVYFDLLTKYSKMDSVLLLSTDYANQFDVYLSIENPKKSDDSQQKRISMNSGNKHKNTPDINFLKQNSNRKSSRNVIEDKLKNWQEEKRIIEFQLNPISTLGLALNKIYRFMNRRNINPFKYRFVCWPYNYCSIHWVLIVVDTVKYNIIWMDSMLETYKNNARKRFLELIEVEDITQKSSTNKMTNFFFQNEYSIIKSPGFVIMELIEEYMNYDYKLQHPNRKTYWMKFQKIVLNGLPQQSEGSSDCGIYMCQFARSLTKTQNPFKIDFDQIHIPHLKLSMAMSIAAGKLLTTKQEVKTFVKSLNIE